MPKAMLISTTNVDQVSEIAKWNLEHDTSLDGYWYVEDAQLPYGYVDAALITPQMFDTMFKIPHEVPCDPEKELISVDYK
jgi:hypothetical protein